MPPGRPATFSPCSTTMQADPPFTVSEARLPDDLPAIEAIRRQVFIEEQGIPAQLEWDDQDTDCRHVLARTRDGGALGTGRIDPHGRIGRLAVLGPWRGQGIGTALLHALLAIARQRGHDPVTLHAQLDACGLYRRAGFSERGTPFTEAGILHVIMEKCLLRDNTDSNGNRD